MMKMFSNLLKFSSGSFIFLSVINRFLISFKRVNETFAMSPSFNPKINNLTWYNSDYVLVWKLDFSNKEEKKDQLVYLNHPYEDKEIVRYLIGVPGDWIRSKQCDLYNRIPDGHCWVECLNGEDDSNSWGPIPLPLLIGKPIVKIRPFRKFVLSYKIENNIRKKLNVEARVLSDDKISESFYI